ncbi:MAG: MBL fold metallo-hydrolase [Ruminococcaceae bacterium]|nr:MBL fold metallo-hydrolase [Oscillospiraceae bacterium]
MKINRFFRILFCIVSLFLCSSLIASCNEKVDGTAQSDSNTPTEATEAETEKATSSNKKPSIQDKFNLSSKLDASVNTLPEYTGKPFDHVAVDLGDGSYMNIAKKTSLEEYEAYKKRLEEAGYELYTTNEIGENRYATYHNDSEIVNAMFFVQNHNAIMNLEGFRGTYEVRVTVDRKDTFGLPSLKEDNVYTATQPQMLTLISDTYIEWPGRMGYVFQMSDGSFFIIDGGYTDGNQGESGGLRAPGISTGCHSSAPFVMEVLKKYAPDPENITIAAWLITHMHEDHFGAFIDLALNADYAEDKARITIENVIYSASCDENTKLASDKQLPWTRVFRRAVSNEGWGERIKNKVKAHPGQQFFLRDLEFTVYTSEDLLHFGTFNPYEDGKYINNTSIVTMVKFMGKDMLFLADSSAANNPNVLTPIYNTELKADILQVAHHGYADTDAGTVLKYVKPEIVFWPVYAQHFYGYEIGYMEKNNKYGGVKNVGFNSVLFADGIRHYVHGSTNLTFLDFENWIPEPTDDPLQIYDPKTWVPNENYMKENNYK